jgi:hypothetical protein
MTIIITIAVGIIELISISVGDGHHIIHPIIHGMIHGLMVVGTIHGITEVGMIHGITVVGIRHGIMAAGIHPGIIIDGIHPGMEADTMDMAVVIIMGSMTDIIQVYHVTVQVEVPVYIEKVL